MRNKLSHEKDDLDKSITHLTEAVLLPFQPGEQVILLFFPLACILFDRYSEYRQPEDVISSLKYLLNQTCYARCESRDMIESFSLLYRV
jgi:hypothetical protein